MVRGIVVQVAGSRSPTTDAFPGGRRAWRSSRVVSWLPSGISLPENVWALRHRWVVSLLVTVTAVLPLFGLLRGFSLQHTMYEALLPATMAALACWPRLGSAARSSLAGTGLVVVSAIVVELSNGAIEAHFLFFVMVPIVALYESWLPFGLAIALVLAHHGIMGTLDADAVYSHHAARADPWIWAGIHAALFAVACLGALVNWKLHEQGRVVAANLSHKVHHDALTGLPNRTMFHEMIGRALIAAESGGERPTVLLLDLDNFKDVNDTLGHHHGDLLLAEVARRLQASMRSEDAVARLGGDEFAVLLVQVGHAGTEPAAQRITDAITEPFLIGGVTLDLEVSIGIATAGPGDDVLAVVRHADTAMYAAKEHKLGYTTYTPGQDSNVTGRFNLLGALRRALDSHEIVLHFQPKVAVDTGETLGVEALARWEHPTRGLLGPAEFIPILENTTLSHRFTSYVISTALAQTRRWLEHGIRLPVSVNVSTRRLLDPRFPDSVAQALLAAGVPGDLLYIEITEDTVLAHPERAIDVLRRIRVLGVKVAIDDFGTGYSSMGYLRVLPVDEIKVDKSFVSDMTTAPGNHVLVESAVGLGHSLGLVVVAEGVENAPTQAALRALGCDVAQGYHFARPLPPDEFVAWYRATAGLDPAPVS